MRHDSKLRDISQGIYRLRQINKGQTIDLVITNEDINISKLTDITYPNIYNLLEENDNKYIKNIQKIFMRQNCIGLIRLEHETILNGYNLNQETDKCDEIKDIFHNNIYVLRNQLDINKNTYKKDFDTVIINQLINYLEIFKDPSKEPELNKIKIMFREINELVTNDAVIINTNIQTEIEKEVEKVVETLVQKQYTFDFLKDNEYGFTKDYTSRVNTINDNLLAMIFDDITDNVYIKFMIKKNEIKICNQNKLHIKNNNFEYPYKY